MLRQISVPFTYTKVGAQVTLGNLKMRQEDDVTSIFDMVMVPVTTSYHFNQLEHLSFNLTIWAPTGDYQTGRLANNGMNVWTYVPTVLFTKIMPKPNLEFTTTGRASIRKIRIRINKSGVLSSLDALIMKRYKNGFAIGGVFDWIQQLSDDQGGNADRLNGFRGRSVGIGPNFLYSKKLSEHSNMDLQFRWIPEFAVKNRTKGNVFVFSAQFVLQETRLRIADHQRRRLGGSLHRPQGVRRNGSQLFYPMFRIYYTKAGLFDGTWKLPDVELMK